MAMSEYDFSSRSNPGTPSLNRYLPELVNYTDVTSLLSYLIAEGLVTFEERHSILALGRKHLQIPELLCILMTKGVHWYQRFRRALQRACTGSDVHSGHRELLKMLPDKIASDETSCGLSCECDYRSFANDHSGSVICECRSRCFLDLPAPHYEGRNVSFCMQPENLSACTISSYSSKPRTASKLYPEEEIYDSNTLQLDVTPKSSSKFFFEDATLQSDFVDSYQLKSSQMMRKHKSERETLEKDFIKDVNGMKMENKALKDEIQKLKYRQEKLLTEQKESFEKQMKIVASQTALQSVEAEDVQKAVAVAKESTRTTKLSTKKEKQNLAHFKLLLIMDCQGSPDEIRTKFVTYANTIEAIIGQRLHLPFPELGLMGTHEMIYSELNVKVTFAALQASSCSSIKDIPFIPDLLVYSLEKFDGECHHKCINELTKQFTPNIWEHCVICVSSLAFELDLQAFNDILKMSDVSSLVSRHIPKVIMPPVAPGITAVVLNSCIAELCMSCIDRTFSSTRLVLIRLNSKRLIPADKVDIFGLQSNLSFYEHPIPVTISRGRILHCGVEIAATSNAVQQIKKLKPHFKFCQFGKRIRSN